MSITALYNLNRNSIKSIYSQNGSSNKYDLKSSSVSKEIAKLEEKMRKGQISPENFENQKKILESLPQTLYTRNGDTELQQSNASEIDFRETKKEIDSIERKHAQGDMSEFAYKANMHLMTTPIPEQDNLSGQKISFYA